MKKRWLGYLGASALALVVALFCVSFEAEEKGTSPALWMQFFSDGFFLSAVLFLGCGALTFIAEAGNFYGIQFLGYTLVRLFSFRKERFDDRKDYFTYCTEKMAKQKEKGKSAAKWIMLYVGLGCLALSLGFAFIFYGMR
ncbi:MAG: hypothetical protein ACI4LH_06135 [Candidatus Heritagella sp.]